LDKEFEVEDEEEDKEEGLELLGFEEGTDVDGVII